METPLRPTPEGEERRLLCPRSHEPPPLPHEKEDHPDYPIVTQASLGVSEILDGPKKGGWRIYIRPRDSKFLDPFREAGIEVEELGDVDVLKDFEDQLAAMSTEPNRGLCVGGPYHDVILASSTEKSSEAFPIFPDLVDLNPSEPIPDFHTALGTYDWQPLPWDNLERGRWIWRRIDYEKILLTAFERGPILAPWGSLKGPPSLGAGPRRLGRAARLLRVSLPRQELDHLHRRIPLVRAGVRRHGGVLRCRQGDVAHQGPRFRRTSRATSASASGFTVPRPPPFASRWRTATRDYASSSGSVAPSDRYPT